MTKKWKCISIRPPLRWVKIAEQDISPNVARTSRERLVNPDRDAPTVNGTTMDASARECPTLFPVAIPIHGMTST
jgi:hypothetical protein